MEENEIMREQIFQIIDNQINQNDPPETKETYQRLANLGYNDFEVKQLIGQCIASELFNIMKNKKPFNPERYIKNLKQLPKEPVEDNDK